MKKLSFYLFLFLYTAGSVNAQLNEQPVDTVYIIDFIEPDGRPAIDNHWGSTLIYLPNGDSVLLNSTNFGGMPKWFRNYHTLCILIPKDSTIFLDMKSIRFIRKHTLEQTGRFVLQATKKQPSLFYGRIVGRMSYKSLKNYGWIQYFDSDQAILHSVKGWKRKWENADFRMGITHMYDYRSNKLYRYILADRPNSEIILNQ